MKVRFIEVGREKKTWEAECPGDLTYEFLLSQIRQHNALYSSFIDFTEDGTILAGFRTVGRFEVLQGEGVKA